MNIDLCNSTFCKQGTQWKIILPPLQILLRWKILDIIIIHTCIKLNDWTQLR